MLSCADVEGAARAAAEAANLMLVGVVADADGDGYEVRLQTKTCDYFGAFLVLPETSVPQLHADLAECTQSIRRGAKLQDRINRSKVRRDHVSAGPDGAHWWRFDPKSFVLLETGQRFGKQTVVALNRTDRTALLK